MSSNDPIEALLLSTIYVIKINALRKKRNRRCWVKNLLRNHEEAGFHNNLIREMRLENNEEFFRFFRMTPQLFEILLNDVSPLISKRDTNYRKCMSPRERLDVTLRYLVSGDAQVSQAFGFRLARSTVSGIVKETCCAIWKALNVNYLKFPDKVQWQQIAEDFKVRWNFPHCVGAIDGKHVQIQCPPNSGSLYYNYKGTFSKVLLAIADASYRFTYVDIGGYGGKSDGGTFSQSSFKINIESGKINWPNATPMDINGVVQQVPYFLVGDEAFPLKEYLLRPYPGRNLDVRSRIFNYRLSRARRVVENAFGILSARWRILRRPVHAAPETVDEIIKACVCLHNFLLTVESYMEVSQRRYCPPQFTDSETGDGTLHLGEWRSQGDSCMLPQRGGRQNNYSSSASSVRTTLANYFCENGCVPGQMSIINRNS